jgi:hypothetical protein
VQHPIGTIHAILRTLLVLGCWTFFPEQRLFTVGLAIVFVYCLSIWRMLIRPIPELLTSHEN